MLGLDGMYSCFFYHEGHEGVRRYEGARVCVGRRHGTLCVPPAYAGRPAEISALQASFLHRVSLGLG